MVWIGILFESSLILLAYLLGYVLGVYPHHYLIFNLKDFWIGILSTVPLVFLFFLMLRSEKPSLCEIKNFLEKEAKPFFRSSPSWVLLLLCLSAGVGEEVLFRGVLQPAISEKWSPLAGLWITSFLFGLAHFITRSYAFIAALIGLYLGCLFNITNNLWVPIVCHAAYDFIAIQLFLKRTEP